MLYRRDQSSLRADCQSLLDGVPLPDAANFDEKLLPALLCIKSIAKNARLVVGATVQGLMWALNDRLRAGDRESCRRLVERALPVHGRIRWGVAIGGAVAGAALLWLVWRWSPLAAAVALAGLVSIAWIAGRIGAERIVRLVRASHSRVRRQALRDLARVRRGLSMYAVAEALSAYDRLRGLSATQGADEVIGWAYARAIEAVAEGGALLPDDNLLLRAWADARALIEEDQVPAGSGDALAHVLLVTGRCLAQRRQLPHRLRESLDTLLVRAPEAGFLYRVAAGTIDTAMKKRCDILEDHISAELELDEGVGSDVFEALTERCERQTLKPPLVLGRDKHERVLTALADNVVRHGDQQLPLLLQAVDYYAGSLVPGIDSPGDDFVRAMGRVGADVDRRDAQSSSARTTERTLERLWALRHRHSSVE